MFGVKDSHKKDSRALTAHLFRNEYGKIVSTITRYIGTENVHTAEDVVQETMLKAIEHWQHHGIPNNPQAWLYKTAINLTLNILKRKKHQAECSNGGKSDEQIWEQLENLQLSDQIISDEQLKMMFICCHPAISENSQVCLILKILGGFSISEIANAFFTSKETINKRLVRGRNQLRKSNVTFEVPNDINDKLPIVLKAIYLIFNEGYSPTEKNKLIRFDLCLEAIRLSEILVKSNLFQEKLDCYALLALMYLHASRFHSRMNEANLVIEMNQQNRKNWHKDLLNNAVWLHGKVLT